MVPSPNNLPVAPSPPVAQTSALPISGKYRLGKILGSGGMGTVHVAEHIAFGERVALKVLRPELAQTPEVVERFLREARSLFRIHCENVVRVLDVEAPESGPPFLVMEYVEGASLESILERRGALEAHEAIELVRQTCEGLGEAHRLGIVHRDVKPHNVMVTARDDGSACVKLVDFGIAQVGVRPDSAAKEIATRLTMTEALIGTPCYMAPEQLRSARAADARSDVWSVGVLFFELLTGDRPWDAASPGDLVFRQFTEEVPLSLFGENVSKEIRDIVLKCLAIDPSKRWQNAIELADALGHFARPIAASALVRVTPRALSSEISAGERRRNSAPASVIPQNITPSNPVIVPPGVGVPRSSSSSSASQPPVDPASMTFARQKILDTHGGLAFERHDLVPRSPSSGPRVSLSSPADETDKRPHHRGGGFDLAALFSKSTPEMQMLAVVLAVVGLLMALGVLLVLVATTQSSPASAKATPSSAVPPPPSTVVVAPPSPQPTGIIYVMASSSSPSASPSSSSSSSPATSASAARREKKDKGPLPTTTGNGGPASLYTDKW